MGISCQGVANSYEAVSIYLLICVAGIFWVIASSLLGSFQVVAYWPTLKEPVSSGVDLTLPSVKIISIIFIFIIHQVKNCIVLL